MRSIDLKSGIPHDAIMIVNNAATNGAEIQGPELHKRYLSLASLYDSLDTDTDFTRGFKAISAELKTFIHSNFEATDEVRAYQFTSEDVAFLHKHFYFLWPLIMLALTAVNCDMEDPDFTPPPDAEAEMLGMAEGLLGLMGFLRIKEEDALKEGKAFLAEWHRSNAADVNHDEDLDAFLLVCAGIEDEEQEPAFMQPPANRLLH